jgi:hypothetical protein
MPIWDGAVAILFERSSDGQTATALAAGDAVLARCDDAGAVTSANGSALMWAQFSFPHGIRSHPNSARVDVWAADRVWAGTLTVRRFTVTPFSKRFTIAMSDARGTEVGELSPADKKGRSLAVSAGGSQVAALELSERDRSVRRTVERWSLSVGSRPAGPAELLAAATVLRYGKIVAEVSAQARDRMSPTGRG